MARTFTYRALVLQVRSSGESNREATFLTAEEGILRATLFGGPKSKLRAHVAPFHSGTLYLYHDPVRDSRKVTDFDVRQWRPGIRESYERILAANAMADTLLTAYGGGGNWKDAETLALDALDALEGADDDGAHRSLIRFLWIWTELSGLCPDLDNCGQCACTAAADEVVYYSAADGMLYCADCAAPLLRSPSEGLLQVSPGARRWLWTARNLDARSSLRVGMDQKSSAQAKALATEILAGALGRRLSTWDECGRA
jgi:DNA repair protein RecO (recombination protein O)